MQAPPIGTKGTVIGVDDIGSIMVRWDNGCGLSVAYGVDRCIRIEPTAQEKIAAFAKLQMDGMCFCPRCGRMTVKDRLHTNALSRYADVYICDACGTDEALRDWSGNPLPDGEWVIAQLPIVTVDAQEAQA